MTKRERRICVRPTVRDDDRYFFHGESKSWFLSPLRFKVKILSFFLGSHRKTENFLCMLRGGFHHIPSFALYIINTGYIFTEKGTTSQNIDIHEYPYQLNAAKSVHLIEGKG